MLRAFKIFREANPQATLSILGAGPLESELKKLAQSMGLGDSVFFRGRSSKIYEFLLELDAFILTSKYEGFGMVLLEAMDASLPIVSSDNSAIPEVLGSDFLGLCQTGNPNDFAVKLTALLENDYRNQVMLQQQARLELFNSTEMARKISGLYLLDMQ